LQIAASPHPFSAASEGDTQHLALQRNAWLASQQAPLPQSSELVSGHGDPDPHARAAKQMRQASSSARGTVIPGPLAAGAARIGKRTTRTLAVRHGR
jgi:hypothetical protein